MRFTRSRFAVPALLLCLLSALPASAATFAETAVPGGDFSGDWRNFTVVEPGATTVSGTWFGTNDYDFLAFTGLASGAQTLTLAFSAIGPQDYDFSAGGSVMWKTSPLLNSAWEGNWLGGVNFGHYNHTVTQTLILALDDSFAGNLFLQLYGTNTGALQYNISAPGNASSIVVSAVSAVPLPAAAPLLMAGIAGLFGIGAWRRRSPSAHATA